MRSEVVYNCITVIIKKDVLVVITIMNQIAAKEVIHVSHTMVNLDWAVQSSSSLSSSSTSSLES